MIKRIFLIVIFGLFFCAAHSGETPVVKSVTVSKQNDIYHLNIEFHKNVSFVPRIHVLSNGLKIFLSFDRAVSLPPIEKGDNGVVKGYFFEKFGPSSLMFIMAFHDKAEFIDKKYTDHSLKISFKFPKKHTVVIDAGHGGKDPGTQSPYEQYFEKNITLAAAIELRNALLRTKRYNVVLTRDDDSFVSFEDRANLIDTSNGDFVISLHTDYNNDRTLRGISIYTLPDSKSLNVAKSKKFTSYLVKYIPQFCKIKKHTCRSSDLKILKNDRPSVLIELGCISNKTDSKLLLSKLFREKIIYAILYALDEFFEQVKDER